MLKKIVCGIVGVLGITGSVIAGDITDTGMYQADLYTYLSNTKTAVNNLIDRARSQTLNSAGLRTEPSGSTTAEAANAFYAIANGVVVTKTAGTDMAALPLGTVTASKENLYFFFISQGGTLTCLAGTSATTLADVGIPTPTANAAMIGILRVQVAAGGTFTASSTALDAGSITASYINTTGMVDISPGSTLGLTGL